MKKIALLAAAALVLALTSSCINVRYNGGKNIRCKGTVEEKTMDLSDFQRIVINGGCDIYLTQGDGFKVSVKANEEVFDHLNYYVDGDVLMLETVDNVNIIADTYKAYITLPTLKKLTVNGAADADLDGGYSSEEDLSIEVNGAGDMDLTGLKVPSLTIQVNGAGDIDLNDIDVQEVSFSVNGAGDVYVSGKADKAEFNVSGVGGVDAKDLDCDNIQTHKTGVASIKTK